MPVKFVGVGEGIDDLKPFDAEWQSYVQDFYDMKKERMT